MEKTITLTFGCMSENHIRMEKNSYALRHSTVKNLSLIEKT